MAFRVPKVWSGAVRIFGVQDLNALTYGPPRYFGNEGRRIRQTRLVTLG